MKRNGSGRWRRDAQVYAILIALLAGAGCAADAPASGQRPGLAIVIELAQAFARNQLSAQSARAAMGANATATRNGQYWEIRDSTFTGHVVLQADNETALTSDAQIRLESAAAIDLGDLQASFGPYQVVHASQTSSVSFTVDCRCGLPPSTAFVRLSTPEPSSTSPVVGVQLRR